MSFTKEDFKDRIHEIISEKEWNANNSELIDFNIKTALRAMPLIAAKLDFNASEESKLQELLYILSSTRLIGLLFQKIVIIC